MNVRLNPANAPKLRIGRPPVLTRNRPLSMNGLLNFTTVQDTRVLPRSTVRQLAVIGPALRQIANELTPRYDPTEPE